MYPRAMNNKEKAGLKVIKESGLAYELKYEHSRFSGGYRVNVPELIGRYSLNDSELFTRDLNRYRSK